MQWVYPADRLGSGCHLCSGGTSSWAAPSPKPSSPAFETAPPQNQSPPASHWTLHSESGAMQGDTENHICYHHLHFLMLFIQCGLRLLDPLYVWEYWRTREQSSCMTCPNSWKKVSTSWCCRREGQLLVGFVKLATMAATGILRFPSGPTHPGWSPKHAAWPYLPSLQNKTDQ